MPNMLDLIRRGVGLGSGGAAAFTPLSKSGLQFWAKADGVNYVEDTPVTPAVSEGDRVGYLTDFSGNSKPGIQGTTNNKGTLRVGANGINGLNCIRLDGGSDFFSCTGLTKTQIPTTGDVWMVALVRPLSVASDQSILYLGNYNVHSPNFHNLAIAIANTGDKAYFNGYDGSEHRALTDSAISTDTVYLFEGVRASGTNYFYLNGVLQATTAASGTPNINAGATLHVGAAQGGGAERWSGDIGELLVYDSAPSAAEQSGMQSYMQTKWDY